MRLFEGQETINDTMVSQLWPLLENFGIIHSVIAFCESEDNNLGSTATTFWFIIDFESLKFLWVYEDTFFVHMMFKVC